MGLFSKPSSKSPPGGEPAPLRKVDIEVLQQDLAAGAEFQQSLQPKDPAIPGYDLGVFYRGARSVSGDFYDFLPLSNGRFLVAIADASGKGIPACILAMTVRALLRAQPEPDASPAHVLANVNRMLTGSIKRGMFVSSTVAHLDPKAHTLTIANGGHLPTVIWKAKARIAMTYPSKGPVLGVVPPASFLASIKEDVVPIEPGDRFLLITDGVNEAMAPGASEFGMEHLRKRLQAAGDQASSVLLKSIADQIDIHRSGGEQSDDITIVTGRRIT